MSTRDELFPRNDSVLSQRLQAFAEAVTRDPKAYFVDESIATELAGLAQAYDQALMLANGSNTRTSLTIAQKDASRTRALERFRQVAAQIRADYRVTDQARLDLGMKPAAGAGSRKMPIAAPATCPLLNFIAAIPSTGEHRLTYSDSNSPDSPAKPYGVLNMELRASINSVGQPISDDPQRMHYVGGFTKSPFRLTFGPEYLGKQATLMGRWVTRTGLTGPWSQPITITIAAGSSQPNVNIPTFMSHASVERAGMMAEIKAVAPPAVNAVN